jgi:hypothetical protein
LYACIPGGLEVQCPTCALNRVPMILMPSSSGFASLQPHYVVCQKGHGGRCYGLLKSIYCLVSVACQTALAERYGSYQLQNDSAQSIECVQLRNCRVAFSRVANDKDEVAQVLLCKQLVVMLKQFVKKHLRWHCACHSVIGVVW